MLHNFLEKVLITLQWSLKPVIIVKRYGHERRLPNNHLNLFILYNNITSDLSNNILLIWLKGRSFKRLLHMWYIHIRSRTITPLIGYEYITDCNQFRNQLIAIKENLLLVKWSHFYNILLPNLCDRRNLLQYPVPTEVSVWVGQIKMVTSFSQIKIER